MLLQVLLEMTHQKKNTLACCGQSSFAFKAAAFNSSACAEQTRQAPEQLGNLKRNTNPQSAWSVTRGRFLQFPAKS